MGIIVNLAKSNFEFRDPKDSTVFEPINNLFYNVMHSFYIAFAFDWDSRKGLAPPADMQFLRIGIVQNVVYDKLSYEYEGGHKFNMEFTTPALDSSASIYKPFIYDPLRVKLGDIQPDTPPSARDTFVDVMVPVRDLLYAGDGYGELMSPKSRTGVAVTNDAKSVDMIDMPRFGARMRFKGGIIRKAERILSFRCWLIAKMLGKVIVLANVPVFSIAFWLETQPLPNQLSIGAPDFTFGFYGAAGIEKKVNHVAGLTATIPMKEGAGDKSPVLDGQTANERDRQWLKNNGLLP